MREVKTGYLTRNPASPRLVKAPKRRPPDIRPFESLHEVEKVARASGEYRALIIFACATGLRPEEWIPLRWDDLDLKNRNCRIKRWS